MKTALKIIKKLFVWIIMAGLMAACQSRNATPTISVNPTNILLITETPVITPTPNAEGILNAIVNALLTLYTKPNRMQVSTVIGDGQAQNNVIEFIPPDRKHIIGDGAEYIVIGEKVYAKTGGNAKWEETQIPASSFLGDKVVTAKTISDSISDIKPTRRDQLDGKSVIVYSYSSTTTSGGIELHSQTELWVGDMDGLPYKMISDGQNLSVSTDPKTGESKYQAVKALTTTLMLFDVNISIEPPNQ
jgi:hypothetical protein